jgi:hypothetical protein
VTSPSSGLTSGRWLRAVRRAAESPCGASRGAVRRGAARRAVPWSEPFFHALARFEWTKPSPADPSADSGLPDNWRPPEQPIPSHTCHTSTRLPATQAERARNPTHLLPSGPPPRSTLARSVDADPDDAGAEAIFTRGARGVRRQAGWVTFDAAARVRDAADVDERQAASLAVKLGRPPDRCDWLAGAHWDSTRRASA